MSDASVGDPAALDTALLDLAALLQRMDRVDLARRLSVAVTRLRRPSTVVCVVGEFKQGKSSLINALIARDLCPVDDDLATSAITVVRHGDEATATVLLQPEEGVVDAPRRSVDVPVEQLRDWVSEIGNPANGKRVERVDVTVPSQLLATGLVLVDTPGMGGLGAGHAAATMSFLPFADGLVFCSDASAELSAPEIEFLRRACELCPTVMMVLTKIDLHPEWRRILEIDQQLLQRFGVNATVTAVSSAVRFEALARNDREMNDISHVPDVVRHLRVDVVEPAKATEAQRAVADAMQAAGQLRVALSTERDMLADPARAAQAMGELQQAKERLDHLRGPGARWNILVGDRLSDLSNDVSHRFRSSVRAVSKDMDERIEHLTKGNEWDAIAHTLQSTVAEQVASVFGDLEGGRLSIRGEIVELLRDDDLGLDETSTRGASFDPTELWQEKRLDPNAGVGRRAFSTTVTTVRGAQGGIYMFGMLGQFLPAAGAVLLLSNPVLLGIGVAFGSVGLADDRKRKIAARRQAARVQVRQFLDDVQFEMTNQIGNLVREIQRDLRDEFTERITELTRTLTDTLQRGQADVQRSAHELEARRAEVAQWMAMLDAATERIEKVPT